MVKVCGADGGSNEEKEHGLRDCRGKKCLEMRVCGELFEQGHGGTDDAPLDGRHDGRGGEKGKRLRFNRQLIEKHGEAVLQHGAQGAQTHAFAARSGEDVDEVNAVVAYDLLHGHLWG